MVERDPAPDLATDPHIERTRRIRGRDRAVLLAGSACAALMFALALLHAAAS